MFVIGVLGFAAWNNFFKPVEVPAANTSQDTDEGNPEEKPVEKLKVASDTSLGSGFAVKYPETWKNVHEGAKNPQSQSEPQVDKNTITSPSGDIKVILTVEVGGQIGGYCQNDAIKLKYLDTDKTPHFDDGRFAAYVVHYPSSGHYQYHVGLQKNTKAIRSVTLTSDSACNFFYSEFIRRETASGRNSISRLSIMFTDQESSVYYLNSGLNESDFAKKLSGAEYEQAKAIVQSIYIKSD